MKKATRFLAIDAHADTLVASLAEGRDGEVRALGSIPNEPEAVRKLVKKLGDPTSLRACYEAGPTGYALYWQLTALGVKCDVVAPTLVPTKPGDRVKTDRRDATKLVRCFRAGELTPVWVPDPAHEALRDLVRAREAAKKDQLRARHRLGKFLLRLGRKRPTKMRPWGTHHMDWVRTQRFEHAAQEATHVDYLAEVDHAAARIQRLEKAIDEAVEKAPPETRALIAGLQALRGVAQVAAVTLVAEVGRFSRFEKAKQLMGYSGLVPSEHSSGSSTWRGGITKTGNAHLRRVLVEAAWNCRYRPSLSGRHGKQAKQTSAEVRAIAWKAQHRLHGKYRKMAGRGKPLQEVATAVARELLGFVWAVGVQIERQQVGNR
jgi:transposase